MAKVSDVRTSIGSDATNAFLSLSFVGEYRSAQPRAKCPLVSVSVTMQRANTIRYDVTGSCPWVDGIGDGAGDAEVDSGAIAPLRAFSMRLKIGAPDDKVAKCAIVVSQAGQALTQYATQFILP